MPEIKIFDALPEEEILAQMCHFQQDTHTFPLGGNVHVEHRVTAYLLRPLVVELSGRRIVPECVIFGIISPIHPYLEAQHVAHDPELVVIREEGAQKRNGYDFLIRTPLQQYPVVQMESA